MRRGRVRQAIRNRALPRRHRADSRSRPLGPGGGPHGGDRRRRRAAARPRRGGRGDRKPGAAPSAARAGRAVDRELRPRGAAGGSPRRPAALARRDGGGLDGVVRSRVPPPDAPRRRAFGAARVRGRGVQRSAAGGGRGRRGAGASGLPRRGGMVTVDRILIPAPLERVFAAAATVERWPEILPHYRWVRFLERREGGGIVEMAAWRPFGPLRYPTWWVSEMTVDARGRQIRYRHVRGITRGMNVVWRFAPVDGGVTVTIVHEWRGPPGPPLGPLPAGLDRKRTRLNSTHQPISYVVFCF